MRDVSAIEPRLAQPPKRATDAAFGRIFGLIFVSYGAWPLVHSEPPRYVFAAIGCLFLLVSRFSPHWLARLNFVWMKFGELLHRIVSPVVMSLVYIFTVVPTGLVIRLMGKDLLRLRREETAASYWIVRNPAGPSPQSMKQQF